MGGSEFVLKNKIKKLCFFGVLIIFILILCFPNVIYSSDLFNAYKPNKKSEEKLQLEAGSSQEILKGFWKLRFIKSNENTNEYELEATYLGDEDVKNVELKIQDYLITAKKMKKNEAISLNVTTLNENEREVQVSINGEHSEKNKSIEIVYFQLEN